MIIYHRRKIESDIIETDELNVRETQAAINSDGRLTIRNVFDGNVEAHDTMVVFTREETEAVMKLFRLFRERDLPY